MLSHKAVREKIVRAFLIEEQKIVMKVLKAQGKNYLAEPDVIVHNKETFFPSMSFSFAILVFSLTLKV